MFPIKKNFSITNSNDNKTRNNSNNIVYYSKNNLLKKVLIGVILILILGLIIWVFNPSKPLSKIESEITAFEQNDNLKDYKSIKESKESILIEINNVNTDLSEPNDKSKLNDLENRLNSITSKKIINLIQINFDKIKDQNNLKYFNEFLTEINKYKPYITENDDSESLMELELEFNNKIKIIEFNDKWIQKIKEIEEQVKIAAILKWRQSKYIGGCDEDEFEIFSPYIKQNEFSISNYINDEDHKKTIISFTYVFTSKINHGLTELFNKKRDWNGNYSVEIKGKINLEGYANGLSPDFQPDGDFIINAIRI